MRLIALFLALVPSSCAVQFPVVATQYYSSAGDVCHFGCDWDVQLTSMRSWGPFVGAHFATKPKGLRSRLKRSSINAGIHLQHESVLSDFALELGGELGIGHPDPDAAERSGFYLGALSQVVYRVWGNADPSAVTLLMVAIHLVASGRIGFWSLAGGHEDLELGAGLGLRFTIGSDIFEEEFMRGDL